MEIRLDGRKALITGGSKGLGLAMATTFAESGADVALLARTESEVSDAAEALAAATGRFCRGYACDVANASEIDRTFALVRADFGEIDILVNNAGVAKGGAFESITDEEWQYDFDLKLMAAVRLSDWFFLA